jgi:hypothetical protein
MSAAAGLVLDFTLPAKEILLSQINHDNGTAITPEQIRFGHLGALPATDPSGHNTTVYVITAQGAQFEGSGYFNYDRIDISAVPGERSTLFALTGHARFSDLLPDINARLSLNLTRADIVDARLPPGVAGQDCPANLVMAANALLWTGSLALTFSR